VFVRWRVNLDELGLAGRNIHAARLRLFVAFFRSESDVVAVDTSAPVDEFPVQAGWHEGFFSLSRPGGCVAAGLILKGVTTDFEILAMSGTVTLPEPVATLPENPEPSNREGLVPAGTLDQLAPRNRAPVESPSSDFRVIPQLGRSGVESSESIGSSQRLASNFDPSTEEAPIHLEMTFHTHGRLLPGQRLRLGDREMDIRPDGRFSYHRKVSSFSAIWPFLHSLLAHDASADAPSFELISEIRDSEASLVVHSSVEISGVLRDPGYRNLLPSGVEVDSAGCFRVERPLPAGAVMLPHLVLLATEAGD